MISAHLSDAGSLVGGWLVGSAVSVVASLVLLPNGRTGIVRRLLASWLRAAAAVSNAVALGDQLPERVDELRNRRDALLAQIPSHFSQPGAVGHRQRALASMIAGARWTMPLAERLTPLSPLDSSSLGVDSADALTTAADLVEGLPVGHDLPDIPEARTRDLDVLVGMSPEVVKAHYPARLVSIAAMSQLFYAAMSQGRSAPLPDVGHFSAAKPSTILRENLRWNSLWLHNAMRTGLGAAACVLIVRWVGLNHGLWVVLASLAVTQVSISGASGASMMAKIIGGAALGVIVAGLVAAMHLPYPFFIVVLPIAAFFAKQTGARDMFTAQFMYTQFALINFSVLMWPPEKGLELVRIQDIALGAVVAAGFTLLVFPSGVSRLLAKLQASALESARAYLAGSIKPLLADDPEPQENRQGVLNDLGSYEDAIDAAFMHAPRLTDELMAHERASAIARDLLIGGDACAELASLAQQDPKFVDVASELADWWRRLPY